MQGWLRYQLGSGPQLGSTDGLQWLSDHSPFPTARGWDSERFSYLPEIKQLVSSETGAGVQGQPHISLYTGSKLPRNLHKLGASSKGDSKRLSKTTGSWRITTPAEEVSMSSTRKDMTKNMYMGSPGSTRKPGLAQQSLVVA